MDEDWAPRKCAETRSGRTRSRRKGPSSSVTQYAVLLAGLPVLGSYDRSAQAYAVTLRLSITDWPTNGYSGRMRVKLLCFGVLKDLLGLATEEVQVPEGSSVADLLRNLEQRTSNSVMDAKVWRSLAVAVNREYSPAGTVLRDGDEVALLPPVSGGSHAR